MYHQRQHTWLTFLLSAAVLLSFPYEGFGFQPRHCPYRITHREVVQSFTSNSKPTSPSTSSSSSSFSSWSLQAATPITTTTTSRQKEEEEQKKKCKTEIQNWLRHRLNLNDKDMVKFQNYTKIKIYHPPIKRKTTDNDDNDNDGDDDDDDDDSSVDDAIATRIQTLDSRINWLQTRLSVSDDGISKIFIGERTLIGLTSERLATKLDWLQLRLNMNDKQLAQLIQRYPPILTRSIEENLSPKLTWLQQRLELNSTDGDLRRFILSCPTALSRTNGTLEDKLSWFENRFSFDDDDGDSVGKKMIKKSIKRSPTLLSYDVATIDENLTWFQQRLELSDLELRKVFQLRPGIFIYDMETTLENQLSFLSSYFELKSLDELRTMICKFPQLIGLSSENIQSTMTFYQILMSDLDDGTSATTTTTATMKARQLILDRPHYLGFSLEQRLEPRLDDIRTKRLIIGKDLSIHQFVRMSKKDWENYISTS